ncbi:hypothetical protein [Calothrix sp. 336/3]|nr:hypothetical protein [Calothrix sp. 336/3]
MRSQPWANNLSGLEFKSKDFTVWIKNQASKGILSRFNLGFCPRAIA